MSDDQHMHHVMQHDILSGKHFPGPLGSLSVYFDCVQYEADENKFPRQENNNLIEVSYLSDSDSLESVEWIFFSKCSPILAR